MSLELAYTGDGEMAAPGSGRDGGSSYPGRLAAGCEGSSSSVNWSVAVAR